MKFPLKASRNGKEGYSALSDLKLYFPLVDCEHN